MKEFFDAGKVVPVTDRRYSISEDAETLQYFGEEHVQEKILITI